MKQYVFTTTKIRIWLLLLFRLLSISFLIVITNNVITAQETNVLCQDILTEFASCLITTFDLQNDAILCDTCHLEYSNYINNLTSSSSSSTIVSTTTCNDIETIQCLAIKECPCNTCNIQLEEYFNCEYINSNFYFNNQCTSDILDCRTSIVNCDNSFNEYRNCIYRLPISNNNDTNNNIIANGKACDDCRLNVASNFVNGGTCNAAQTNFCIGINGTCATVCGNCIDEMDFFFTCDVLDKSNGNCQIDCNTTTSTPPISDEPLCSNELSDFAICVTQDLTSDTDSVACDTCRINVETSIIETSISNNNTCSNIQQITCNEAIPNCTDVCGTCIAPLANYWICYSSIISFLDCSSTTCNLVNSPNTVPSSVAPTTFIPSPISTPTTNSPIILSLSAPSQTPIITPVVNNPQVKPVSMPIIQPSPPRPTTTSQATIIVSNTPKRIIVLIAILYLVS